jgi:hypothetical protein
MLYARSISHQRSVPMSAEAQPATKAPPSLILGNVPRLGFDVLMSPFPGSLVSYLTYIGEPADYDLVMGYTGAAFRRFWNRDDGGNIDLSYLGDEPFRRVFWALGYAWKQVPAEKDAMITGIKKSLTRGKPAISFGIIGPPEAGLVTGYDEDGVVLHGWSYFQDWPEYHQPHYSYYTTSDWFETMDTNAGRGLILVGYKVPAPEPHVRLLSTLEWAIELERTPVRSIPRVDHPDHVAGLAAYDAWADALEVDEDYPADNPEILGIRVMVHGDQCTMTCERHNGAAFLRKIAAAVPHLDPEVAQHLQAAADLYDADDRMGVLWPWGYDMGPDAQQGLAQPATRRDIAAAIREIRAREEQAVVHLEQALMALKAG